MRNDIEKEKLGDLGNKRMKLVTIEE